MRSQPGGAISRLVLQVRQLSARVAVRRLDLLVQYLGDASSLYCGWCFEHGLEMTAESAIDSGNDGCA